MAKSLAAKNTFQIMKLVTFEEWLNESKSEEFVNATLTSPFKNYKKGDVVKVNALQYTKGGKTDKMEILLPDSKKDLIEKKFLEVKF
jgi:hypothetical protein